MATLYGDNIAMTPMSYILSLNSKYLVCSLSRVTVVGWGRFLVCLLCTASYMESVCGP